MARVYAPMCEFEFLKFYVNLFIEMYFACLINRTGPIPLKGDTMASFSLLQELWYSGGTESEILKKKIDNTSTPCYPINCRRFSQSFATTSF
jgi:hypothetical protein